VIAATRDQLLHVTTDAKIRDMSTLRQLTINQAAHELGVTRRTIERRIQKGDIVASYVNGKRYVHISDNDATSSRVTHDSRTTLDDAVTQIATLRTELDTIRQERDYLRQHVSELTATLYRLGDQKALTAPQVEPNPWWAFWRRNKPQQTAA
jgi:excisionase family DNA binding protein